MTRVVMLSSGFLVSEKFGNFEAKKTKLNLNTLNLANQGIELADIGNEYKYTEASKKISNYVAKPNFDNLQAIRIDLINLFNITGFKTFLKANTHNPYLSNLGFEALKKIYLYQPVEAGINKNYNFTLVSSYLAREGEVSSKDIEDRVRAIKLAESRKYTAGKIDAIDSLLFEEDGELIDFYKKVFAE